MAKWIIPNGIAVGDNHRYTPDVSLFASDGPQTSLSFLSALPSGYRSSRPSTLVRNERFLQFWRRRRHFGFVPRFRGHHGVDQSK